MGAPSRESTMVLAWTMCCFVGFSRIHLLYRIFLERCKKKRISRKISGAQRTTPMSAEGVVLIRSCKTEGVVLYICPCKVI